MRVKSGFSGSLLPLAPNVEEGGLTGIEQQLALYMNISMKKKKQRGKKEGARKGAKQRKEKAKKEEEKREGISVDLVRCVFPVSYLFLFSLLLASSCFSPVVVTLLLSLDVILTAPLLLPFILLF